MRCLPSIWPSYGANDGRSYAVVSTGANATCTSPALAVAAITTRRSDLGWIKRRDGNRSVEFTQAGRAGLADELGVSIARARPEQLRRSLATARPRPASGAGPVRKDANA